MRNFFLILFLLVPFAIFADFWKELNKVVEVLEEIAAPSIANICMAEGLSSGRPVGVASSFPKNTRTLHVWFNIYGASSDVSISSVWMREQEGQFVKIYELSKTGASDKGQSWMDFSLAVPDEMNWPVGKYKVDIVWNNKILGTVPFQINDTLKGGQGVWNPVLDGFPATVQDAKREVLGISENTSILTEDEKYMVKHLTEPEIIMTVNNKIHGIVSEYGSLQYKYRNTPEKLPKARAEALERITRCKQWGNEALAVKGLPPRWNLNENPFSDEESPKQQIPTKREK